MSTSIISTVNDEKQVTFSGRKRPVPTVFDQDFNHQKVPNPTLDDILTELIQLLSIPTNDNFNNHTEWCCWTERFEKIGTANSNNVLKDQVNHIGFQKLKNAFELLNQACESALCEPEDLVGIYKRHVFKKITYGSDTEKTRAILKYLDLTIINWMRMKKLNQSNISNEFLQQKKTAARVITPLLITLADLLKSDNAIR